MLDWRASFIIYRPGEVFFDAREKLSIPSGVPAASRRRLRNSSVVAVNGTQPRAFIHRYCDRRSIDRSMIHGRAVADSPRFLLKEPSPGSKIPRRFAPSTSSFDVAVHAMTMTRETAVARRRRQGCVEPPSGGRFEVMAIEPRQGPRWRSVPSRLSAAVQRIYAECEQRMRLPAVVCRAKAGRSVANGSPSSHEWPAC